jgi:hypothetical protein
MMSIRAATIKVCGAIELITSAHFSLVHGN